MAATFHAILRRLAAVPPAYFVFAALVLVRLPLRSILPSRLVACL